MNEHTPDNRGPTAAKLKAPEQQARRKIAREVTARTIDYLLARALVAAYNERNHRPFIALARIVARIAEIVGVIA